MTGGFSQTNFISYQTWTTSFSSYLLYRLDLITQTTAFEIFFQRTIRLLLFLLLDKVFKMQIVSRKILDFCQACSYHFTFNALFLFLDRTQRFLIQFEVNFRNVYWAWQCLEGSRVGHSEFDCFLERTFDGGVVTKLLPLSIDTIHRPSWKESKSDETKPINLIFVLFSLIFLCNHENLNEFSHSESSSLSWQSILPLQVFL